MEACAAFGFIREALQELLKRLVPIHLLEEHVLSRINQMQLPKDLLNIVMEYVRAIELPRKRYLVGWCGTYPDIHRISRRPWPKVISKQ